MVQKVVEVLEKLTPSASPCPPDSCNLSRSNRIATKSPQGATRERVPKQVVTLMANAFYPALRARFGRTPEDDQNQSIRTRMLSLAFSWGSQPSETRNHTNCSRTKIITRHWNLGSIIPDFSNTADTDMFVLRVVVSRNCSEACVS